MQSDIYPNILKFLSLGDIFRCLQINKDFYRSFYNEQLWKELIERDFECDIPILNRSTPRLTYRAHKLLGILSNTLKKEICELNSMEEYNLLWTAAGGKLPLGLGEMYCLKKLNLRNIQLRELSLEIGNLAALTQLDMSNNLLEILPLEFGKLISLTNLNMSYNNINELPLHFGELTSLTHLNLSNNKFNKLPKNFGNLSALENLDLSHNEFEQLPIEIVNLSALKTLILSYNKLVSIPQQIDKLHNLISLDLCHNQLCSLPIVNLDKLEHIGLFSNKFTKTQISQMKNFLPNVKVLC